MRISCASLVRIVTTNGRLALLVNKNGRKQGLTVLAPLGGATEVDATLGRQIMSQLNLTDADFDKPPTDMMDLRFTVDDALVDEVRRSFLSWDSGPEREIREELVDETGILTQAELNAGCRGLTFVGVSEEQAVSTRTGKAAGQTTLRLISVYDLSCGAEMTEKLEAAHHADPQVYFVTLAEIEAGRTESGVEIATISKSLLHPSPAFN